jgi:uncharacterized protein
MLYLFVFIIIVLIFIYISYENKNLEVTHYTIQSKKLPKSFHGSKFIVIADLHNNTFGKDNFILIQEIDKINPDFIVIAGDLIVGNDSNDFTTTINLLSNLSKKYTIYYGYGNHEQRVIPEGRYKNRQWKNYLKKLHQLKIHILENKSMKITKEGDSIEIVGLAIDLHYFRKQGIPDMKVDYLEKLVGKTDKKCYNIVIAHNPVYFKEYIKFGADLVLSGHIHGGMIRLPFLGGLVSPQYELFPKYDAGKFAEEDNVMLVSKGLGTHTIKIRVFNRPELMVVTLEK